MSTLLQEIGVRHVLSSIIFSKNCLANIDQVWYDATVGDVDQESVNFITTTRKGLNFCGEKNSKRDELFKNSSLLLDIKQI